MSFEIRDRDGAGRVGRFQTAHGTVTTPALMPVINPNLHLIGASEMHDRFGAQMVITNSYIIRKDDELRNRALRQGVHGVLGFEGPVMTDSGTFQSYVYGDVDVTNEEIVSFQREMGSDVGVILDVFSTPDRSWDEAREDLEVTVERAREADEVKGDMLLALPVQGGVHPDLRTRCAEAYHGIGDVHPIGGVVPLMEEQRYATLVDVIVAAKRGLDPSKPVHLFGAGHPHVFPLAALLGCDLFDSAAYAKFAADDRMLEPHGTVALQDLRETTCPCPVCTGHTARELQDLPDDERKLRLAEHNLFVSLAEVRRVREAIRQGSLWELVERRARAHPRLLQALRAVADHVDWIEAHEPLSKRGAVLYTGPETLERPLVRRWRRRLRERFDPRGRPLLLVPPSGEPFARAHPDLARTLHQHPVVPAVPSILGLVPLVLEEAYPAAQHLAPDGLLGPMEESPVGTPGGRSLRSWDHPVRLDVQRAIDDLGIHHGVEAILFEDLAALRAKFGRAGGPQVDLERLRVEAVADLQFGPGAGDALLEGEVELVKSPRTGKVRNVHVDGEHVLSLRARDGYFTLKAAGARRLHRGFPAPRLRVAVDGDSVPFNRDGKSVFAGFVEDADDALRPGDECLVVGPGDELVAVGRLVLAPHEMRWFDRGVACDVREGIPAPRP